MKPKRSLISKILIGVGIVLLVIVGIAALLSVKHVQRMPSIPSLSSLQTGGVPFTGGPQFTTSTAPTGVPVPADDVLQAPR